MTLSRTESTMNAAGRQARRWIVAVTATATASLSLAACGGGNPLQSNASGHTSGSGSASTITVGSANFTADQVLADIYAEALDAHGVSVHQRPNIGPREIYIKALKDHSIDMIPEFTGNLLDYFAKPNPPHVSAPQDVYQALRKATPEKLAVLRMAAAQDKDTLTVTRETASNYHLKTYGDLKGHAKHWELAAPSEFKTRYAGSIGLKKLYGVTFSRLKPVSSARLKVQALTSGNAKVADIFSLNPQIGRKHLVVLKDPKSLFTAQNIVPLIRKSKASPKVKKVLNAVSAKLTTKNLSAALAKVQIDKADPHKVATHFLAENGLT
jgi:osmoprotectant transport system substrate-binding protein